MRPLALPALAALLLVACTTPPQPTPRTAAAKAAFVLANPCPATGASRGACPGWVVDHIEPLCAGGADAPSNMQWQTAEAARVKDRDELRACAAIRRYR